ncbi:MAG TPA: pitrilysin family protein [bacterium]|nr:pitrilysin family protein [bacterium]HPG47005.1 pitrilysin family protein [bacterium]HPM99227.1 pitrilysin family protein [bacterium]
MKPNLWMLMTIASLTAAQAEPIRVPYTSFYLPNGLHVILHEEHTVPMVSVNIWYHVGSSREKPGRTGFAHLFEHIMFEGSAHVPEGKFDEWLEAAGAKNNGSTSTDRTNYWMDLPSNALDLALFLESDRMGYLLQSLTPESVEGQRQVVMNERRQNYENEPYGLASILIAENLYPPDHPYHWPTIGSMEDLQAATFDDVVEFFQSYYGPQNAGLAIAGDIDLEQTRQAVEKWFGEIPAGPAVPPLAPPAVYLTAEKRLVMQDKVQLPRLYMTWSTPAAFHPGDAECDILASLLAGGKNSRLYKRLVYEQQLAQDVAAYQFSSRLASEFLIVATARQGHSLTELEKIIQEEVDRLRTQEADSREVQRTVNQVEAQFLENLENVGGFSGKADLLNRYFYLTGIPDYFNEDLQRYRSLETSDVRAVANRYLRDDGRVVLSVVPLGHPELAAQAAKEEQQ